MNPIDLQRVKVNTHEEGKDCVLILLPLLICGIVDVVLHNLYLLTIISVVVVVVVVGRCWWASVPQNNLHILE